MIYGISVNGSTDLNGMYIVWSPEASAPPQKAYSSRADAIKVAYHMASKHPSQRFAVCKIVGEASTNKVEYKSFDE